MPPDVREWLPQDHFAWFVLEAVESMDLDPFYAAYRADGRSRPAFDPAMMVALANEHQIVLAAEIEVLSPDFGGITELPKTVVADSGYWHTEQMQRLAAEGIQS